MVDPFYGRERELEILKELLDSGLQIDYMIQARFNTLYLCEIKFYKERIGMEIIKEMQEKLNALSLPRGFSVRTVLIHVNGVKEDVEEQEFFLHIIDFSQLLTQRF